MLVIIHYDAQVEMQIEFKVFGKNQLANREHTLCATFFPFQEFDRCGHCVHVRKRAV